LKVSKRLCHKFKLSVRLNLVNFIIQFCLLVLQIDHIVLVYIQKSSVAHCIVRLQFLAKCEAYETYTKYMAQDFF